MKSYQHIKENERELIFLYLNQGKNFREISKLIGRNHRTIAREVKRNQGDSDYSVIKAQTLADIRRSQSKVGVRKLDHPGLADYVIKRIGKGWSPETIAGRLKHIKSFQRVSHETIYRFIYQEEQKKLRPYELLRRQHRKRHLMMGRKTNKKGMVPNRVFIDNRPGIIDQRQQLGHWGTDLMEEPKKTQGRSLVCSKH